MPRTNMDIDDEACAEVMRRYLLKTTREAINLALRALAAEPLRVDEARRLRGSGWQGDLGELWTSRWHDSDRYVRVGRISSRHRVHGP